MDLQARRTEYEAEGIDPDTFAVDPFDQFGNWFDAAVSADVDEPSAMVLSTVDGRGRPRGRNVLLRGVDSRGFVFYTNHTSDKARALEASGFGALTFHWYPLHRQVHVEGAAARVSDDESDAYFASRPRESQLGAWASDQSSTIESRSVLLDRLDEVTARFDGVDVPRPEFWGGWRIDPVRIEFWQGQPSRLHDRVRYDRDDALWHRSIVSP